jgi:hypothetical protein
LLLTEQSQKIKSIYHQLLGYQEQETRMEGQDVHNEEIIESFNNFVNSLDELSTDPDYKRYTLSMKEDSYGFKYIARSQYATFLGGIIKKIEIEFPEVIKSATTSPSPLYSITNNLHQEQNLEFHMQLTVEIVAKLQKGLHDPNTKENEKLFLKK